MSIYNRKTVRELIVNARGQLIGFYSAAILVSLLVGIIEMLITSLTGSNNVVTIGSYLMSYVIAMIIDVLMGVLMLGKTRFFLNLVRGNFPLTVSDVFYGIKNSTDKAIIIQALFTGIQLVISLPMLLMNLGFIRVNDFTYTKASLILMVLSVIAVFAAKLFFGLSYYILNDHPDMTAKEVLLESIHLMEKNKGRYICLCLRLIPIAIVSICAFGIGLFWFSALQNTSFANFYLDVIEEEPFNPTVEKEPAKEATPDPYDYSI